MLNRPGRVLVTIALSLPLAFIALPGAHADDDSGRFNDEAEDTTGGDTDGQDITASAGITFTTSGVSGDGSGGGGTLTSTDSSWSPPPCWYAPTMTPSQFKAEWEDYLNSPLHSGKAEAVQMHEEAYGPDSEYEDHNIDKEGEGMWWEAVMNEDSTDYEAKLSCDEPRFWVDFGDAPPDIPGVPTPDVLAELAYERITVPDTEVELNPEAGEQVVNLPTWVWLNGAEFEPVEVTARIDGYDVWATTRAEPVSLTISAGTEDAELHPSSGECAINDDGTIGEPYADDRADETPPCGVTYLRATHATDAYELTASLTWEVSWEGSGGTGGDLPDGVFETTHEIAVDEVQAIVR